VEENMTLLEELKDSFTVLNKQIVDDGYGGYKTVWTDGATFDATLSFDESTEARIGDVQGARDRYTVYYPKILNLEYHDVFRRNKDQKVFRATSNGEDNFAPDSASPDIRVLARVTAEEWEVTS
jgi:hypothetical protein